MALLDLGTLESSLQDVLLEFLAGGSHQRMAVSGWHPIPCHVSLLSMALFTLSHS